MIYCLMYILDYDLWKGIENYIDFLFYVVFY